LRRPKLSTRKFSAWKKKKKEEEDDDDDDDDDDDYHEIWYGCSLQNVVDQMRIS
jgi:hypothetical protein